MSVTEEHGSLHDDKLSQRPACHAQLLGACTGKALQLQALLVSQQIHKILGHCK